MNYKDEFFSFRESFSVDTSLFELLQDYHPKKNTLHLFVEDDDDYQFYRSFALRVYSSYQIIPHKQRGKGNVLEAYQKIDWKRYSKCRVLFFYDKDYDDILGISQPADHNIFCTMYYSLENYLVNTNVVSIILKEIFGYTGDKLLVKINTELAQIYKRFVKRLRLISSWILIYRKTDDHCDLDRIAFEDLFVFDKDGLHYPQYIEKADLDVIKRNNAIPGYVKARYREGKLRGQIEVKTSADPSKFCSIQYRINYQQLKGINEEKSYLRGKYNLWFITRIVMPKLKMIAKEYNDKAALANQREGRDADILTLIPNMEINANNIFHVLPGKMDIPVDLNSFLSYNYNMCHGVN
ncbi:DUF4435 domain-containing protein [Chitinophaga sp. CF418]|uniref:DUF4435 domain-containing protein n=1 Tax=Chitinophaga sp. CF418 TaxID=1855287 RepID=UPI00091B4546|nr:DUF4435 domain-containing protein [Chitinophaga sp. CF418]SHN43701.1 Protein of unknown function [Chitinophaga sp. CF418]